MANFLFNVARGSLAKRIADGATLKLLVLQAADSAAVLKDLDTVATVLANGSTTEANFSGYARPTLANATATVDDATDTLSCDADDVLFASAGGALNNTAVGVVIYEDVDTTDANAVPLLYLDAAFTTDGNDVTLQFDAAGFYTSSDPV